MSSEFPRRHFLKTSLAAGMVCAGSEGGFLKHLPTVSAQEMRIDPNRVGLQPEIEPLVRLLEETPRNRLLERVAEKIRTGTTYREVLTALQLAGVRNIQPRPQVGFKFHAVLVVNSAHLASLASPAEQRWLPIFWALDYFKSAQAQDEREGDWTMQKVDEARLPAKERAFAAFAEAMDRWDESGADTSVTALAREHSAEEIYEVMFRYGMRDFRSIGHKAIFVANSDRTLKEIGWQHAEPVLRSLAYALLMHEGSNPAERDSVFDQDWRKNLQRVGKIRADWTAGKSESSATGKMMALMRTGSPDEVCEEVVARLNAGLGGQSIWDAVFCGAGELLVKEPGISAIHVLTTANALHYAYSQSKNDETRRLALLQAAAFVPWMREQRFRLRGEQSRFALDQLNESRQTEPAQESLVEIFRDISGNRMAAARQVLGYLNAGHSAEDFMEQARLLIFFKGRDSHDYKFSSAVLEDYYHVSPEWRNRFLASSVYNLAGSQAADNQLVNRTRAALGS